MPNINGGPQDDPRWAEKELPMDKELPKFDFQNMDVKLYLALKTCVEVMGLVAEREQAKLVLEEFQLSRGPLPDWAIDWNWGYELVPGAQLQTKDGRRHGNAHILRVHEHSGVSCTETLYDCITDAGSYISSFSAAELENAFWVGDYISDPKTLIARFDRSSK